MPFLTQIEQTFFYLSGFSFLTLTIPRTTGEGRGTSFIPLYHFHPLTNIETFATLHVRWLSCIFNRNACVYQTATQWDLPPYAIKIWLVDWWCNVCLFTWWIDSRFLLLQFWHWKAVDLNFKKKNFMAPFFYGWGSTASRLDPLQGGSLLFTTKSCYSLYWPRKDERLSRPWSRPLVLNTGPLDWESSALTTGLTLTSHLSSHRLSPLYYKRSD